MSYDMITGIQFVEGKDIHTYGDLLKAIEKHQSEIDDLLLDPLHQLTTPDQGKVQHITPVKGGMHPDGNPVLTKLKGTDDVHESTKSLGQVIVNTCFSGKQIQDQFDDYAQKYATHKDYNLQEFGLSQPLLAYLTTAARDYELDHKLEDTPIDQLAEEPVDVTDDDLESSDAYGFVKELKEIREKAVKINQLGIPCVPVIAPWW